MTDEDVVDQFLASSVDSAESLLGRNARGEVPKPARHLCRGGQTRWCRSPSRVAVDDLRSGSLRPVVEVAEHDNGTLRMAGEEICGDGAVAEVRCQRALVRA